MLARYYSSSLARFMAVDPGDDTDPENPQSWNKYAYVRNNPIVAVDEQGTNMGLLFDRQAQQQVVKNLPNLQNRAQNRAAGEAQTKENRQKVGQLAKAAEPVLKVGAALASLHPATQTTAKVLAAAAGVVGAANTTATLVKAQEQPNAENTAAAVGVAAGAVVERVLPAPVDGIAGEMSKAIVADVVGEATAAAIKPALEGVEKGGSSKQSSNTTEKKKETD